MTSRTWHELYSPDSCEPAAWELFHENSKRHSLNVPANTGASASRPARVEYDAFPKYELPGSLVVLDAPLWQVFQSFTPSDDIEPRELSLEALATLLYCAVGAADEAELVHGPFDCWKLGSSSTLAGVQIVFHARSVAGLPPGTYAYDSMRHELRQLRAGDQSARIASNLVPRRFAVKASLVLFVVGHASGAVDSFGERGYRQLLLEAGQLLRSLDLACHALGLGCVGISEFRDRETDAMLDLDGLWSSTLHLAAIGGRVQGTRV